jgi:hypothetical protein
MEEPMQRRRACAIALATAATVLTSGISCGRAQIDDNGSPNAGSGSEQSLELTAAQRSAIYAAVSADKSKVAPQHFSTAIGANVPPMIELYALPDDVAAANPAVKFFEYTMVQDKVVLVDPTKMRVIDVIGPVPQQ